MDTGTAHDWGLNVLLIRLLNSKIPFWCVKVTFRWQGHTYPMPVYPPVPNEVLVEAQTKVTWVLSPMVRWYEDIVLVMYHAHCQTFLNICEEMCRYCSMTFLCDLSMILIVTVSNLESINYISLPVKFYFALTSSGF